MRSVSVGRRPAITSSSSRSFGSVASARATSSRLRSGKRQRRGELRALVVQIEPPQHLVRALRARRRRRGRRSSAPTMTLSSTVRPGTAARAGRCGRCRAGRLRRAAGRRCARRRNAMRAGVGREHAGDHVEQRGLAGAVRADHREDRALRHREAHVVRRRAGRGSACEMPSTSSSAVMSRLRLALAVEAERARERRPDAVAAAPSRPAAGRRRRTPA